MTGRKSFYVFGGVVTLIALAYGNGSAVQGEQREPLAENGQNVNIRDKIVVLEIIEGSGLNSESDSAVLANARVLKIGHRDFIVGDSFPLREGDDDWHKEVTDGIPCDNIVRFRSMSPDRFKTYAKKWLEQAEE
jgi:hypothetical protein